jgi:cardiolipin synthase
MLAGIDDLVALLTVAEVLVYCIGILCAIHAVMNVQSSRGAIAWGISLITFPWLAIPLYLIFGKNEFWQYAKAMRNAYKEHYRLVNQVYREILEHKAKLPAKFAILEELAETFTPFPFTVGNQVELLIDGQQTYKEMLQAIDKAKDYILLQSYIINDDRAGNKFRKALSEKAKQGVRICFLYDKLGSRKLSRTYLKSLEQHGIKLGGFGRTKNKGNRFQINFRNHRKILIVDGQIAFMGGLNIGDEYLGEDPHFGSWRDTHLKICGAAVQCLQSVFLGDWYWVTKEIPEVCWEVTRSKEHDQKVLILPTGPADRLDSCNLFFLSLIERSQSRLWIASPYFVPNNSILDALKLAVLRGVDVRIILPNKPDRLTVYLCSFSYYTELEEAKIKIYRYRSGFMHQKVILVDRDLAGVGTVNLDNRSFFLNFEVMTFSIDTQFIQSVETILEKDLKASRSIDLSSYEKKPFWFKLGARASRLLAPIL